MRKFKILILGKGRIGQAISYYLKKSKSTKKVAFFSNEKEVKNFDILIGALPGEIGEESLKLALKYENNLIDVSDLEPEFYLKKKREINKKRISVIPGCGFCPGLVNLILGKEIKNNTNIEEIEIKAGTLSPKKFFFPFLWCFEDLILEHRIPSWQIIASQKRRFIPFTGNQKEKFFDIEAESYFAQSGFDNLIKSLKVNEFKFRVVRPFGFFYFFQYLKNLGFLKKANLEVTQKILESQKEDNLTLAEIKILTKNKKIIWQIKSFSKKTAILNSMQKVAGLMPVILANLILEKKIKEKGVLLMEEIGKNEKLFKEILGEFKKEGVMLKREESQII